MNVNTNTNERYVTTPVAAKMIKKATGTLCNDRTMSRGLPYVKISGRILYDVDDIHRYLADRKITPED